jgi:hypothetical protein
MSPPLLLTRLLSAIGFGLWEPGMQSLQRGDPYLNKSVEQYLCSHAPTRSSPPVSSRLQTDADFIALQRDRASVAHLH